MLTTALLAPVAGSLAARISLRTVMLSGAVLTTCGYVLLSVAPSYPIYLLAFGLLIGPGFATAVVLPPTLVTRWFAVNSGRVLGIVATPLTTAVVPLIATWTLRGFGLAGTYRALAAMTALAAVSCLFIVDHPPGVANLIAKQSAGLSCARVLPERPMTMLQMVRRLRYWALILPAIAATAGTMILTAHTVPLFQSWGMSLAVAASLLSVQGVAGMFGTVFFGWLADRIGGVTAMLVMVAAAAGLWLILLLKPPLMVTAPLVGLIGFHAAGVVPVLALMLSEAFGRENFSRAYGLMNLISLPFSVLCIPAAAMIFARTGSYEGAIAAEAAFLALGAALLLAGRRGTVPAVASPS
jgi:MFS family permease